jgi:hypothetical protein
LIADIKVRTQIEGIRKQVLRRLFELTRDKVARNCRQVNKEDLHNLIGWHVTCMGAMRNSSKALVGNGETEHLEDVGVDGRIILKQIVWWKSMVSIYLTEQGQR